MTRGRDVMLRTDLRRLGPYQDPENPDLLEAHFDVLAELIDLSVGTIVVPTGVFRFNTKVVFDPLRSPSEMGVLTEYVRTRAGAVRSFHPYVSYAAVGARAEAICGDVSRHSFGPHTPEARMVELDALDICVGVHPTNSSSLIHHVEQLMGVPYRYTKEFIQPVLRNGQVSREPFYALVRYLECELVHDTGTKVFGRFKQADNILTEVEVGRGKIFSFSMAAYVQCVSGILKEDIYYWLMAPPVNRPYQK